MESVTKGKSQWSNPIYHHDHLSVAAQSMGILGLLKNVSLIHRCKRKVKLSC